MPTRLELYVLRIVRPRDEFWEWTRLRPVQSLRAAVGPRLTVTADALIYEYPALLRGPVTIPRELVSGVWVRDFPKPSPKVKGWPVSGWNAPDLGGLHPHDEHNLLITLHETFPFRSRLRRLFLVSAISVGYVPDFATPATQARGFWALIEDPAVAQAAFSGWPTTKEISQAVWNWLDPPLPWGFRRREPRRQAGGR
jgi:hypothetical protein